MNHNEDTTALILAGDGYQLTIAPDAVEKKMALLAGAHSVLTVTSNDESADAAHHVRNLSQMRIAVDKCRKEIKEPVLRIGKMIDQAAKEFLTELEIEENRIRGLIGTHATEVARQKAIKEAEERKAFEAARQAREAAEAAAESAAATNKITDVIAARKAEAERHATLTARMDASAEVAGTKIASGVRFAWDFEVTDMKLLSSIKPDFVEITERRTVILAWIKALDAGEVEDVDLHCIASGIRAFKKPVVSTR